MSNILVVGGTGYAGRAIIAEAAGRGHRVISLSRSAPAEPVDTVDYRTGPAADTAPGLVDQVDIVVTALSPRGDSAGTLLGVYRAIAERAAARGVRLVVVGGFSSLRPAADQPRFVEGELHPEYGAEALEMDSVRDWLETSAPQDLDWLFVSPALGFSGFTPGIATGRYRVGGPVAQFDADGTSDISGADFALAVVDEIDAHALRGHIGVAY